MAVQVGGLSITCLKAKMLPNLEITDLKSRKLLVELWVEGGEYLGNRKLDGYDMYKQQLIKLYEIKTKIENLISIYNELMECNEHDARLNIKINEYTLSLNKINILINDMEEEFNEEY